MTGPGPGIGQSLRRYEDGPLLTGRGRFIDDVDLAHQAHAWFVRSPHAHARILSIDAAEAQALPGVLAVLTAAHAAADGIGPLREPVSIPSADGTPVRDLPRPVIAADRVRHVGDTVAIVIAETREAAREAAERVAVDYEALDPVVDPVAALAEGAPVLFEERPGNLAVDWTGGQPDETDRAFAAAAHVTRLRLVNNRVVIAPIETRGVLAEYDPSTGRYTLWTPSQGANGVRDGLADHGLRVARERVRVVTTDVGGAFGMKIPAYPEHVLVAWAARRLARPVKWTAERADAFVTDGAGRDHVTEAALALDADGRFLAVRLDTVSNMGAYWTGPAATIPTRGGTRCATGVYAIPCFHARTRVAFTNTTPVVAYRGAGKPEFNYVIERLVDEAARETGRDPAALRRLNVVPPGAMPWKTPTGLEFDTGEFARNMDDALALADRPGFEARRAESAARGRLRGFGFALFQEPDGFYDKRVSLSVDPTGALAVTMTGQAGGQGHVTTFVQVIAERFGLPADAIHLVMGDSDRIGPGGGTGGSATATVVAVGILEAGEEILAKGRRIAGRMLEASAEDVVFADGDFVIAGTDRRVDFRSVARASFDAAFAADEASLGLQATAHHRAKRYNYPCGCHACEIEVDPETGALALLAYVAVNDHGVVINPMLLEGQVHGGVAQGIGQALTERCVFDPDSGQLLSGSFMDYCLPRADDLPSFTFARNVVPAKTNPLGIKGVGESGCTAALPAVMNAVVDALRPLGLNHIDMPATPETVWEACRQAQR